MSNPDPRDILRRAEKELALKDVYKNWLVSDDPDEHAQSIQKLFDAGVMRAYVHSGQFDQQRGIDFYGNEVLPRLRGQKARERSA